MTMRILDEDFDDQDRQAGLAMHRVDFIEHVEPDPTWNRAGMRLFWTGETRRWVDEYTRLSREVSEYNEFRDPALLAVLRTDLAMIADNVAEAAYVLTTLLGRA